MIYIVVRQGVSNFTVATGGDHVSTGSQIHVHKCKGSGMAHTDCLKVTRSLIHDCVDSNIIFGITLVVVGRSDNLLIELDIELVNGCGIGVFDLEFDHSSTVMGVVSLEDADEIIRRTSRTIGRVQESNNRLVAGSRVGAHYTKCGKE
jgi:hypothetical protein